MDFLKRLFQFFSEHHALLFGLFIGSLLTFAGTLAVIPVLLIKIPPDYFRKKPAYRQQRPVLYPLAIILKNIFGIFFILVGFLMLFIPGQGLLTILIGLSLINFPGKRKLQYLIIQKPAVLSAVNKIRNRAHRPPLEI